MPNVPQIIDELLVREGGYSDRKADRGGPTKYGITQQTLSDWRGQPCSKEDVKNLTVGEARAILYKKYIEEPGYLIITDSLLLDLVVDCAVNHGPRRATRLLQRALGVAEDGNIGPKTLKALESLSPHAAYVRILAERVRVYGRIITDRPSQAANAAGWLNRAASFIESLA